MLGKYTHPNLVYYKHNGDDEPYDFWRSISILSSHLRQGLTSGVFPSGFPTKTLYTSLLSPISATCPAHLILLDFITPTILGEEFLGQSIGPISNGQVFKMETIGCPETSVTTNLRCVT